MKWYTKYLSVYEKPIDTIPSTIIDDVAKKVHAKQSDKPLVSVVLIAHNEESHLLSCVWSLSENVCKYPIEIIGVDNDSTDRTGSLLNKLGVITLTEKRKSPGYARQCGLEHAKGKYHICIDSDTMYPPQYIERLTNELEKENVSTVMSLWSFLPDSVHSKFSLYIYEFLRDIHLSLLYRKRPELVARGMVLGFRTEEARRFGFRVNIIRGEDGSLVMNLKHLGKVVFLKNRKARAITSNNTLDKDGSLFNAFWIRIKKVIKDPGRYLHTSKGPYKDREDNLIHK